MSPSSSKGSKRRKKSASGFPLVPVLGGLAGLVVLGVVVYLLASVITGGEKVAEDPGKNPEASRDVAQHTPPANLEEVTTPLGNWKALVPRGATRRQGKPASAAADEADHQVKFSLGVEESGTRVVYTMDDIKLVVPPGDALDLTDAEVVEFMPAPLRQGSTVLARATGIWNGCPFRDFTVTNTEEGITLRGIVIYLPSTLGFFQVAHQKRGDVSNVEDFFRSIALTPQGHQEVDEQQRADAADLTITLEEATTKLAQQIHNRDLVLPPPSRVAKIMTYKAPLGEYKAYRTLSKNPAVRSPAIVWITGGDCNVIGTSVFDRSERKNDQTAAAFREAGIITVYPALRGGNSSTGNQEGFLGEVEDVRAVVAALAQDPEIDPRRIYLGGHSTGGTLSLLAAECGVPVRAVFSLGPVDDIRSYAGQFAPYDKTNPREHQLRAPWRWLHSIRTPTFVLEGEQGNIACLRAMKDLTSNANVEFVEIPRGDHFDVIAPLTELIARKILADTGPACDIEFLPREVNSLVR